MDEIKPEILGVVDEELTLDRCLDRRASGDLTTGRYSSTTWR